MLEIASKFCNKATSKVLRQSAKVPNNDMAKYRFVCCQPKYIYILYCTFTDQRN